MKNIFEEIIENCKHKKAQSLSKALNKKFSLKSGKDIEKLCYLAYWLFILEKIELSKKCINLTHALEFNQNYDIWTFIYSMWGLEIRILKQEGNNKRIKEIIDEINKQTLMPTKYETVEEIKISEKKRRENMNFNEISYEKKIQDSLKDDDINGANEWRFIALLELIGETETGFYPNLNKNKDKIEKTIKKYIEEIIK